ncbi:multidrug transporter [Pseudoroseomonas deserti]|uniref:Multidrug transporter n=1 Tax=Teichococcus deserti TaxID=1817963 RepID=A0A1V2H8T1_9PROT|nr:efflux transporter outer membrane subunit [Pseudoroseomonas deserti]ONG58893.1 multidrug transporter [Pseudoroseomonas deserti]
MVRTTPLLGLAALLLAGCSLDPDYVRPASPVSASWPTGAAYAAPASGAQTADSIAWQDFFLDPALRRLVGIALESNRDLRVSTLHVAAAEATYRAQRGGLFPSFGASSGVSYGQTPADLAGGAATGRTSPVTSRSWSAGLGFTAWELDLFGRVRSQSRAAFEDYLALEETRRAAQITLVAQVADAWLTVLADRELLALTKQTLASQEQSYRLTQAVTAGGTATALTLRQAQTAVETARANQAQYTRQLAQDENALALLLGQPIPADLPASSLSSGLMLADVPAGLSSELLIRRPDVLSAEHSLQAANADIGAARAAFFPSITLTSNYGTAGAALSRLFQPGSGSWSFAPSIDIPIFSGGTNQASLDLAKVQSNIQVANYEKAIQTAFREVADALAARGTYGEQLTAQQGLTDAYADSYRLAELRFRSGVDSYLTTLDSQRELYAAQQTLITLRRDRLASLVTLYKVLGGGWR